MLKTQYTLIPLFMLLAPVAMAAQHEPRNFYIGVQGGASFSMDADMDVPVGSDTDTQWDPSPEGYNNNLGASELLGATLGYRITPLVSAEIEVTHRNSFQYEKNQSLAATPKTRHFDLQNTNVMANAVLHGSGMSKSLSYQNNTIALEPFIFGGIGAAFNTVSNFYSSHPDGSVSAMEADNTEVSFGAQAGAGVSMRVKQTFAVGLGYRYMYGGNFSSNNYIWDFDPDEAVLVAPWKGTLQANEVYLSLSYMLM